MGKLNEDERKLMAELQARDAAPDDDDQFEIEIYDTSAGKGARIPFAKGRGWLHDVFGIGDAPAPAPDAGAAGAPDAGNGEGGAGVEGAAGGRRAGGPYFGRR